MNTKVFILLGLAAIVAADKRPFRPSTSYGPPQVRRPSFDSFESPFDSFERSSFERPSFARSFDRSFERDSDESFEPARYNFQLGVHDDSTSASFEHQEARDLDETQGSYTVQLPDGRRQTVRYFVNGDSGYVAEVTYSGEARYPDSDESREFSARRPSFSAPKAQRPRPSFSSFESQESREFFSAPRTQRPRTSFPRFDSLESREFFSAPRTQRPRTSFPKFDSLESREFFSAPRTQRPTASFPRFDSFESREIFSAPSRAYGAPF